MTPPTTASGPPLDETTAPRHRWLLAAALVAMAATAGYVLHLSLWASGGWQRSFANVGVPVSLAFTAWSLAPMAGAAAVVVIAHRSWPRGQVAAAVGVAALAALTVWSFADLKTSESSTTALVFVFLPPVQWFVVGLAAAAGGTTHHLRSRRRSRHSETPGATTEG
ncbi:hypothetical protein [Quadrisphaera sp. INWT6]|uniref:hypothetical protein n=1 Tax=Quadrisphaera sp. INWT6 TaxID=2596917 RepID=UPI001892631E|nr:hypothetical protein [Quadrisphaera sp. INWT6]MBF5082683.1 hypothetical protein [Quadrisphaera sp. INWT6]